MSFYKSANVEIYNDDCLNVLSALPQGSIDLILADPPYFLSNGGQTVIAGKLTAVDKGSWDKSNGIEADHEFNLKWMKLCKDLLKDNGSMCISGTHHNIHSIGFAAQQLGMRIINSITWEKPNPPPNFGCRCFTHSTETILWMSKSEKAKHTFNYADMKEENGDKQMKDVWRIMPPSKVEKECGKHPTQKPIELMERLIRACSNPGDMVLDPFNGSGTTGVAALQQGRKYIGIEMDIAYCELTKKRLEKLSFMNLFEVK